MLDHHIDGSVLCSKRYAKLLFRESILGAWEGCCAYCGEPAATLDHVRARRRGGATVRRNLVAACASCNRDKGSQEWTLWFRRQEFWDVEREKRLWQWHRPDCA
jgi:5-methylcytosine-specific restriction endonuclease McrA